MMVIKKCIACNESFSVANNRRNSAKFCSRKCFHAYYSKGKKDSRIKIKCEYCDKEFLVYPYRKDTVKFCSFSCSAKYLFKMGVFKPRFKEGDKSWNEGNEMGKSAESSRMYARKKMELKKGDIRIVHHIDNNPFNNKINNLMVLPSQSEHMKLHYKQGGLNKNVCTNF